MDPITCPHCRHTFTPTAGMKAPPWCRRCGGELAARPIGSGQPAEELVTLTAATAAAVSAAPVPAGRWANRKPRERSAPTTRAAADTPAPVAARRPPTARRRREPAEVTHETFDYEAAVRKAGYESTAPSITCYAFAGACLLLPVVGCVFRRVALFLGVSGAGACVKVAHSHGMPMPQRVLACVGIVALTWGTYVALVVCLLGAAGVFNGPVGRGE